MESQGFICLKVSVPGLLGFLRGYILFFAIQNDSSLSYTAPCLSHNHVFSLWSTMEYTKINIWLDAVSVYRGLMQAPHLQLQEDAVCGRPAAYLFRSDQYTSCNTAVWNISRIRLSCLI